MQRHLVQENILTKIDTMVYFEKKISGKKEISNVSLVGLQQRAIILQKFTMYTIETNNICTGQC